MAKFKVEQTGRGKGTVTLERGAAGENPVVLLVFRNEFKSILFQGQLMRNVSRITKSTTKKPQKIQRYVTVVGKKEGGKAGVLKCATTASLSTNSLVPHTSRL